MARIDSAVTDPDVLGAQRLFSAWLEGQMAYQGLPGVAVGVVGGQHLVWARDFGVADLAARTPVKPVSRFRMASHSKLFTATAIMQLREQGKVRLDDPVTDYLPWFRVTPAGGDDGVIRIEQLLAHSAGLPREAGDHWATYEFPTADEIRRLISARKAAFAPAVRWKYSNLAYTIAGMVVEAVSGERWADYVQQHIFEPLGMTASSVDRDVPELVVGYGRRMPDGQREALPFVDARGMAAATGITSNVADMAKFVSAQFPHDGAASPRVLSAGSLREMHRARSVENDWASGNGIGFAVTRVRNRTYVGHGGGYPGYRTQTLIALDDRVGVIVLTNALDADPEAIARRLMATVGAAVAQYSSSASPAVPWDPAWSRFAGLYRSSWNDLQVVLQNERLVLIALNGNVGDEITPVGLEPLGGGRFRHAAPNGLGPVGEVVRFDEHNGQVTRMILGDGFLERLPEGSLVDAPAPRA